MLAVFFLSKWRLPQEGNADELSDAHQTPGLQPTLDTNTAFTTVLSSSSPPLKADSDITSRGKASPINVQRARSGLTLFDLPKPSAPTGFPAVGFPGLPTSCPPAPRNRPVNKQWERRGSKPPSHPTPVFSSTMLFKYHLCSNDSLTLAPIVDLTLAFRHKQTDGYWRSHLDVWQDIPNRTWPNLTLGPPHSHTWPFPINSTPSCLAGNLPITNTATPPQTHNKLIHGPAWLTCKIPQTPSLLLISSGTRYPTLKYCGSLLLTAKMSYKYADAIATDTTYCPAPDKPALKDTVSSPGESWSDTSLR